MSSFNGLENLLKYLFSGKLNRLCKSLLITDSIFMPGKYQKDAGNKKSLSSIEIVRPVVFEQNAVIENCNYAQDHHYGTYSSGEHSQNLKNCFHCVCF